MHVDDLNGVKGSSMSRMFALSSFLLNRNTEVSSVTLAKLTQASIFPLNCYFFSTRKWWSKASGAKNGTTETSLFLITHLVNVSFSRGIHSITTSRSKNLVHLNTTVLPTVFRQVFCSICNTVHENLWKRKHMSKWIEAKKIGEKVNNGLSLSSFQLNQASRTPLVWDTSPL